MSLLSPPSSTFQDVQSGLDKWLKLQRVAVNGVHSVQSPGAGTGVQASRDLKKGERVVHLPASALVTIGSDAVQTCGLGKEISVNGQLAAALTALYASKDCPLTPWVRTWPSLDDFRSMPLLWEERDASMLPASTKALLKGQRDVLDADWRALPSHLHIDHNHFTWFWLCVNSRTFFWNRFDVHGRRSRQKRTLDKAQNDSCIALCPFADFFNHSADGLEFTSDRTGCSIHCDRDYKAGEELYLEYGKHSNDKLLVEYGFVLQNNKYDSVSLDAELMPLLSEAQQARLDNCQFLGNYSLGPLNDCQLCFRTQAALRVLVSPETDLDGFLISGDDGPDSGNVQHRVNEKASEMVRDIKSDVERRIALLQQRHRSLQAEVLILCYKERARLLETWLAEHR